MVVVFEIMKNVMLLRNFINVISVLKFLYVLGVFKYMKGIILGRNFMSVVNVGNFL